MEQGLAQQAAGQDMQMMVQQVVQLLMEGVAPEELLQQGVPMEVIQEAIAIIQAQEQQAMTQQAPANTEAGLAMMAGGM